VKYFYYRARKRNSHHKFTFAELEENEQNYIDCEVDRLRIHKRGFLKTRNPRIPSLLSRTVVSVAKLHPPGVRKEGMKLLQMQISRERYRVFRQWTIDDLD